MAQVVTQCYASCPLCAQVVEDEEVYRFSEVPVMCVTLSCDHRVVDGAVGAEWLKAFKQYVENPMLMIV